MHLNELLQLLPNPHFSGDTQIRAGCANRKVIEAGFYVDENTQIDCRERNGNQDERNASPCGERYDGLKSERCLVIQPN